MQHFIGNYLSIVWLFQKRIEKQMIGQSLLKNKIVYSPGDYIILSIPYIQHIQNPWDLPLYFPRVPDPLINVEQSTLSLFEIVSFATL